MTFVEHGGALDRAIETYGGDRDHWLDLSTGINPNAYPISDIPEDAWTSLPDIALIDRCIKAARAYYNVPGSMEIVAAPGTQSVIQLLPSLLGGSAVSIVAPTYNEHANCWRGAGCTVDERPTLGSGLAERVVVVNPNNPTGVIHSVKALIDQARILEQDGAVLIVDEAFGDVCPDVSIVPLMLDNIVVLKSVGKFFGLAGARLGFAICNAVLAQRLSARLGPWAVSGPALHIGAVAMADTSWIHSTRLSLRDRRQQLEALLRGHGFSILGTTDLFVSALIADSKNAAKVLAKNHILVRVFDYDSQLVRFGIPADERALQRLSDGLALIGTRK